MNNNTAVLFMSDHGQHLIQALYLIETKLKNPLDPLE